VRDPWDKLTRRAVLQRGLAGMAGLAFTTPAGLQVWAGTTPPATTKPTVRSTTKPTTQPAARPLQAKAQAVIQIWLWGGACHLDTFDPKPGAGADYCGPLNKPLATNVKGIQVSELLPLLAQRADLYTLIRSMTHGNNGHETAAYMVQTGRKPGERLVYPCIGAVVSCFKGYDHGYTGKVPPYIVLTSPLGRFSEAGFLGSRYKPFATGGDPARPRFAVEGIVAEGISDERQRARRTLLHDLDTLGQTLPDDPTLRQLDQCEEAAYDLILGDTAKLFDLGSEADAIREQYGKNTFGQSCLVARRLVEQGVKFIAINYRGWDTHKQHFEIMKRKLPELDRGLATLLGELKERGLLDSTIVWCCGEFGRTPRVQWEAPWNGGRGHYGECFSALVAGGGFKGGQVVGASDARGERVAQRPVYPHDMIGSMYTLLGIDPEGLLPHPAGLEVRVTPAAEEGAKDGGRLKEIM
jgi:hypothetical protein